MTRVIDLNPAAKKGFKQAPKKTVTLTQMMFYGDFSCDTGFGHVSKELIDFWSKDKTLFITVFAINDMAEKAYQYADNVFVIPALSSSKEKKDVYCRIEFLSLMYSQDYDLVFCLNDIEVFNQIEPNMREVKSNRAKANKKKTKTIIYFPIDSAPRESDLKVLSFFDETVTYTQYAKNVIKPMITDAQFKKIKVIPHGCNTKEFYPFTPEEKRTAKVDIFGNEDIFVFGSVNRNSPRKDLATLILGYSMFRQTAQTQTVLYLHCNPNDPIGINIERLCQRLGLVFGKDVITPKDYNENKGFSLQQLNKIYNSFDCFITTTTAEGWGLTICEAMATKTIVACPKHTSITEITNNGENSINFMYQHTHVFTNDFEKIRFKSDPTEVAHVMNIIRAFEYDEEENKKALAQKIENAYDFVSKQKWDVVATQFKLIINKLIK